MEQETSTKRCIRCKQTKPSDEVLKYSKYKDKIGFTHQYYMCKTCNSRKMRLFRGVPKKTINQPDVPKKAVSEAYPVPRMTESSDLLPTDAYEPY